MERKQAARLFSVWPLVLLFTNRLAPYLGAPYRIEVENLRDTPQTVYVRDQLPVSKHEQIKVKLETADPKPSEQTELNQLVLNQGAQQVLHFDFSVEYPREMDVSGLTV